MTIDLNKLSKAALSAAMKGGTEGWGQYADASSHVRYCEPDKVRGRKRRCSCGCGGPATHVGIANGLALAGGCELSMRRWVKAGRR
jgi:hypothetical protein